MKFLPALILLIPFSNNVANGIRGRTSRSLGGKKGGKSGKGSDHDYDGNPLPPSSSNGRNTPAEFDDVSHLWIGWPRFQYSAKVRPVQDVVIEMIEALCSCIGEECTKLVIQVPPDLELDAKQAIAAAGLEACIDYYDTTDRDDMWIRDTGPVFTKNSTDDEAVLLEFNFDFWGAPALGTNELTRIENGLDASIYGSNPELVDLAVDGSHMIAEGGNREFNGQGSLLMNRAVEVQRNVKQSWSLERSEDEYMRLFGVENIVWVDGVPTNDRLAEEPVEFIDENGDTSYAYNWGTGGHIDEVARFVNANTIVVAQISDEEVNEDSTGLAKEDQKILKHMYEDLKNAENQDGEEFDVLKAPSAPFYIQELTEDDEVYYWFEPLKTFQNTLEEGGTIYGLAATSYLNFVITNKVILIPEYFVENDPMFGSEETLYADLYVKQMFEKIFQGRAVVSINPLSINMGGGGMHCVTAHQAA